MKFYMIRLKEHPHLFVGKKDITYAIMEDAEIKWRQDVLSARGMSDSKDDVLNIDAHWYVEQKRGQVWLDEVMFRRVVSLCRWREGDKKNATYEQYEALIYDESGLTIFPLTQFAKRS